jgi:hypothetical protein
MELQMNFFETKDQYTAMRQTWATFINSEAARRTTDVYGTRYPKVFGWHFLMYAILRGKDGRSAFANSESRELAIATLKRHAAWNSASLAALFGITDEVMEKAHAAIKAL